MKPLLILTPGDPEGIGPEIAWRVLRKGVFQKKADILCVGARNPFDRIKAPVVEAASLTSPKRKSKRPFVWLLSAPDKPPRGKRNTRRFLPGYQSGWAIETAVELHQQFKKMGRPCALVTGPISKDRLQKGGYPFRGHTDFLAKLTKCSAPTMMLANDQLRVALVTTHLALKSVPTALTQAKIKRTIEHTALGLKTFWGIRKPRIAVAALNPHAGENGMMGKEEIRVIKPAIRASGRSLGKRAAVSGPFPADTLFLKKKDFDAVVCMYHDQGLIPVKLLDFSRTVNITLGLPLIRTSVDHGVAMDLVGTGKADSTSLEMAVKTALQMLYVRPEWA